MKSIIEELYYGNISGNNIKLPKETNDNELKLYDELKTRLSPDDSKLLDKFIETMSDRIAIENCENYKHGFKVGFAFGSELSEKEDL